MGRSVRLLMVWGFVLSLGLLTVNAQAEEAPSVYVLVDRGISEDLTEAQVRQRNQMGEYWEQDIISIFTKRGSYNAQLIESKKDYEPGPDKYLLETKIVKYNAGKKAARMIIGFGAGAVSMDIEFKLSSTDRGTLLDKENGVGSSRDWRNVARKLNELMLADVQAVLAE